MLDVTEVIDVKRPDELPAVAGPAKLTLLPRPWLVVGSPKVDEPAEVAEALAKLGGARAIRRSAFAVVAAAAVASFARCAVDVPADPRPTSVV